LEYIFFENNLQWDIQLSPNNNFAPHNKHVEKKKDKYVENYPYTQRDLVRTTSQPSLSSNHSLSSVWKKFILSESQNVSHILFVALLLTLTFLLGETRSHHFIWDSFQIYGTHMNFTQ